MCGGGREEEREGERGAGDGTPRKVASLREESGFKVLLDPPSPHRQSVACCWCKICPVVDPAALKRPTGGAIWLPRCGFYNGITCACLVSVVYAPVRVSTSLGGVDGLCANIRSRGQTGLGSGGGGGGVRYILCLCDA